MEEQKRKFIRYNNIFTYEILYEAYQNSTDGKKTRNHVIKYQQAAPINILKLYRKLKSRNYKPKNDYKFTVFEPKRRNVTANRFEDKIVQRVICERVLAPLITPRVIYYNVACQEGKGTHFGINCLTNHLRSYFNRYHTADGYILQCDISKYFDNIDRNILVDLLSKLPIDKDLIELQRQIIFRDNPDNNKGLCIGYQCSQWYAIFFLNNMDHYIKEKLRIKYYGRYMDDFYLIHPDENYLRHCLKEIESVLSAVGLKLNKKTNIYPIKNGITFLGFTQHLTKTGKVHIKIKRKTVSAVKRRIRKYRKKFDEGMITEWDIIRGYQAFHAHACHGNCDGYLKMVDKYFVEIFPEMLEYVDSGIKIGGKKIKKTTKGGGNYHIGTNIKILCDIDGFITLNWTNKGAETYKSMFGKYPHLR